MSKTATFHCHFCQIYNFASKASMAEALTLKAHRDTPRRVDGLDVLDSLGWNENDKGKHLWRICQIRAQTSWQMAAEDHGDSIMGVCFSQHARSLATVLLGWKDPRTFFFRFFVSWTCSTSIQEIDGQQLLGHQVHEVKRKAVSIKLQSSCTPHPATFFFVGMTWIQVDG